MTREWGEERGYSSKHGSPPNMPSEQRLEGGQGGTTARLGKRIPGRDVKYQSSEAAMCLGERVARVERPESGVVAAELRRRGLILLGPQGSHKGFLCVFLWGRWGMTGGFEHRSLQSEKNSGSGESPGPLSPVTFGSQLIVLRLNIWPLRKWANYWWSQSKFISSPKSELNTRNGISWCWALNEKVM